MLENEPVLKVLCLEDSQKRGHLLLPYLQTIKSEVYFQRLSSLEEMDSCIDHHQWDIVFSNFSFDGLGAFEILAKIRKLRADLPFILISDGVGEEIVADLMKAGVEDIVIDSRLDRVVPVVSRVLRESHNRIKEREAQEIANNALASKDQMIAVVSHDIKNPLCAIQLQAQMLLRASERSGKSILSEEVKIQANRILKTIERMKLLISDILEKNKTENSLSHIEKTKVNIGHIVRDAIDAIRPLVQEKDITLRWAVPENRIVQVDRNKIFQVLSNLLNNAIKFTPKYGEIQIDFQEDDFDYSLRVQDTGPGIEESKLNKIFEKYWTCHSSPGEGGTGLGLFICKVIVEAHGGHIIGKNNPTGKGACFEVVLPKEISTSSPTKIPRWRQDERKKICIIDDDEDLTELISWVLGLENFKVCTFKSPVEGLRFLSQEQSSPSLIILDHKMDEMMGGEFLKRKNEIEVVKKCPVIMISASPRDIESQVPEDDYKEIITKPIDLEGLVNCIKKYLVESTAL